MRAVNIVGFKDTGKTTLCVSLLAQLREVGVQAGALKYTHQAGLDKASTDTAKLMNVCDAVGAIGEGESAMFWRGKRHLDRLLPLLGADLSVIEGGKELAVMPRVVIAADAAKARELGAGQGGLAIAVYGPEGVDGVPATTDIAELARLVNERAFLLPGLDCGGCGRADCRELAAQIVAGEAAPSDCTSLGGNFTITVNGAPLALNPFVGRMLASGLAGMLGELKGVTPGEVVISFVI